ncbi:aryl-sulfate sulfotransferase [Metapseudomonas lalkuanensis]|uniref:aryl-sulfate sulfotransferase n=1 Tax=Metapseudomonas lalkuanensis TaxID=2604832 RepID=UPI0021F3DC7A
METLGQAALQLAEGGQKQDGTAANERLEGDLPFGDTRGVGTGRRWAHVHAIDYDASDGSIIGSARHQGVVKIGRNTQVKWILASPQGSPSDGADGVPRACETHQFCSMVFAPLYPSCIQD